MKVKAGKNKVKEVSCDKRSDGKLKTLGFEEDMSLQLQEAV